MAARKGTSPGTRLQLGASVLTAARAVDTTAVEVRLQRFDQAHRNYVGAQRKLDTAEAQLRAAQTRLAELDAVQDEAVENLACALVTDGQPRGNPFAAFDAPAPGTLTRCAFAEAAEAVHQFVAVILRSKGVSEATTQAAKAADNAARALEQALAPITKLQDSVRDARRLRDAVGQAWDSALAALRRDTLAAADEGAPNLYARLFQPLTRAAKTKTPEDAVPTHPPAPAATPNAA